MKKSVGAYLVIQITGCTGFYVAEVLEENPLVLKVEEQGPYSRLKSGDYILINDFSERIQDSAQEAGVLREAVLRGKPFLSGLASLGVTDGKMHEILPAE